MTDKETIFALGQKPELSIVAKLRSVITGILKGRKTKEAKEKEDIAFFEAEVNGAELTVVNNGRTSLRKVSLALTIGKNRKKREDFRCAFSFNGGIPPGEKGTVDIKLIMTPDEKVFLKEKLESDFAKE